MMTTPTADTKLHENKYETKKRTLCVFLQVQSFQYKERKTERGIFWANPDKRIVGGGVICTGEQEPAAAAIFNISNVFSAENYA